MASNTFFRTLVLSAAAVLVGGSAGAQSTTQGTIAGTVFDATNAAVPNATVTIHSNGTNADTKLTSDSAGFFKAPLLQPGTYTVIVTAPGFSEVKTDNVVVAVSDVTEVNPHLTTGETSTVVEVNEAVPVIKFDTPSFGGQLSNAEIENIPINNRRWSSLTLLTPGTTNDSQGFGLIAFRAIQPQLNNVQIDGADDNQVFYGEERGRTRAGYSTAQIAVREFEVNTGVYSAEFGRAVGGVINSITKSGTNQIHGEAYFYHRDSAWSAFNDYTYNIAYNPATSTAAKMPIKPTDKRNQYGFGIGGPLIKDKLFGFYAFDQFKRNFPGTGSVVATSFYNPLGTTCTAVANCAASDDALLANSIYNATGNTTYATGTPATVTVGGTTTANNVPVANPAALTQAQAVYSSYLSAANSDLFFFYVMGYK